MCEQSNPAGLQIPYFHDDEAEVVSAEFTLDDRFSGAPNYVHGGVVLAVLDEAMSWATIAIAKTYALTHTTTTTFQRPVKVGRLYRVEARVTAIADDLINVSGRISRGTDAKPCADAEATFVPLSSGQASDAIGEVKGPDASYLKG